MFSPDYPYFVIAEDYEGEAFVLNKDNTLTPVEERNSDKTKWFATREEADEEAKILFGWNGNLSWTYSWSWEDRF